MTAPLILTAHIDETHLEPFDALRKRHFPQARNFLRAHLTMFHSLPGEQIDAIDAILTAACNHVPSAVTVDVSGIRHLGRGVAFEMRSPDLARIRSDLAHRFEPWLGRQDAQAWKPHVTVQNKVSKAEADALMAELERGFDPWAIDVTGLDLWHYLGGPWEHAASFTFALE